MGVRQPGSVMYGDPKQLAIHYENMAAIAWKEPARTWEDPDVRDAARKLVIVLNGRLATNADKSSAG